MNRCFSKLNDDNNLKLIAIVSLMMLVLIQTNSLLEGLEAYAVHFAANGVRGEELILMESQKLKLLVPQPNERARLKHRLKELKLAADKDQRRKERERKDKEKLQRKAEKLAEKASKKK